VGGSTVDGDTTDTDNPASGSGYCAGDVTRHSFPFRTRSLISMRAFTAVLDTPALLAPSHPLVAHNSQL